MEIQRLALGLVGVGAIAEAIVTGLCEGGANAASIHLSPRSAARTDRLAARYPAVQVADSNQSVVDRADAVLVCVRPQEAADVLADLTFREEQPVISVMAGVPSRQLRPLVAPAEDLVRAIPLPAVARRAGLTAIHPPHELAGSLFGSLGDVIAVDDERAFDALSASTATIAAHLAYLDTISRWLVDRGIPEGDATRYVAEVFSGVSAADDYATPGGTNEQFVTTLRRAGSLDVVKRALDEVAERLAGERSWP